MSHNGGKTQRPIFRSVRTEVLSTIWDRKLLALIPLLLLCCALPLNGSASKADAAIKQFSVTKTDSASQGESLEDAMQRPLEISREGNTDVDSNPLRSDYEAAVKSRLALTPPYSSGTVLELSAFVFLPIIFFALGGYVATRESRHRSLLHRVTLESGTTIWVAKMLLLGALALAATSTCAALGAAAGFVTQGMGTPFNNSLHWRPEDGTSIWLQILFTFALCWIFGALGATAAFLTNAPGVSATVMAVMFLTIPISLSCDPRMVMQHAGLHVFRYWGQFQLTSPPTPYAPWQLLLAICELAILLLAGYHALISRRMRER